MRGGTAFLFLFASMALAAHPAQDARFRLAAEALRQAQRATGEWDPAQRDCAGFIRYLYRKTLFRRDDSFVDRHGAHVPFVEAGELVGYNFEFVSRELASENVRGGDLLVFYSPHKVPPDRWHLMLLLEPPPGATRRTLVVYHNGASGNEASVRKVWLDDLVSQSPPEWRPLTTNPRFLGQFRWKGWKERE